MEAGQPALSFKTYEDITKSLGHEIVHLLKVGGGVPPAGGVAVEGAGGGA